MTDPDPDVDFNYEIEDGVTYLTQGGERVGTYLAITCDPDETHLICEVEMFDGERGAFLVRLDPKWMAHTV